MNRFLVTILVSLTVWTVQAQTVDEVVSRHLEAMGGIANLRAIQSVKMMGSIRMKGNTAPLTIQAINHKGMRMDVVVQGMTQTTAITDSTSWMTNPFMGQPNPEPIPNDMQQTLTDQLDLAGGLVDYQAKGNKVSLMGKEKLGTTDVYKLKLTRKSGKVEYDYIDATTYLLAKSTSIQRVNGEEQASESRSLNYKKVNGYSFAFTIKIQSAGESGEQTIQFNTIEINPTVDERIFKLPALK